MTSRAGDRLLVWSVTRRPGWLVLAGVAGCTESAAGLGLPAALGQAVDAALAGRVASTATVLLLTLALAQVGTGVLSDVTTARISATSTAWLRHQLSERVVAGGPLRGFVAGDALSRLTGDCAQAGAVATATMRLALGVLTSLGAVLALALLGWWLAVVFVASVPLALLLARSHLRSTTDHVANYWRLIGELAARLLDAACGLRTIAATGTAEQETARVLRPLRALHACGAALWRHQANMVWRAALLVPTVQLSMLAVGGFAVLNGTLSTGALIAALGYAGLGMRVVGLMPLLTTVASARAAADRIAELLHTPVPAADTLPLSPGPGVVELRGVQVAGESGAAALREIDLVLPAGALVAVIGRADAGPSTLAAVVAGLVEPDRGAVLLDGVPLVRLRRDELRTAVGIAFARPTLLGCSVGEAIGYGRTSDDQSIRAAAVAAAVHDTVVRLPDGYATPLAAAPLSGGEAQRLGLARALVTQPRLLVLDDATASLDTVTEARIDEAIRTTLPGTTRLIVTHRLLTAERADLVVWLDNGALRGADTHPVLWRDPQYRAVFEQAPG